MGSFVKHILKGIGRNDPLTRRLTQDADRDGWVSRLGSYRDLVVHTAPLAHASGRLFSVCEELHLPDDQKLPAIRCPIPEDPASVSQVRAKGEHLEDFEKHVEFIVSAAKGDVPTVDGMSYASSALGLLSRLADDAAEWSPVEPRIPIIHDVRASAYSKGRDDID